MSRPISNKTFLFDYCKNYLHKSNTILVVAACIFTIYSPLTISAAAASSDDSFRRKGVALDGVESPLYANEPRSITCRTDPNKFRFKYRAQFVQLTFSTHGVRIFRKLGNNWVRYSTAYMKQNFIQNTTNISFPINMPNGSSTGVTIWPAKKWSITVTLTPTLGYIGSNVTCGAFGVNFKDPVEMRTTLLLLHTTTTATPTPTTTWSTEDTATTTSVRQSTTTSTSTDNIRTEQITTSKTTSTSTDGVSVPTTPSPKRNFRHDVEEEGEPLTVYIGLGICSLNLITVVIAVWTCRFLMREGD